MKESRERLRGFRMEYPEGTILWWNGREIEVVRDIVTPGRSTCRDCVLRGTHTCIYAVECSASTRKDGTGVHFENVRKEERI